jgi:hypothetical protein
MSALSCLMDRMEVCSGLSREGNCFLQYSRQFFDEDRRQKLAEAPVIIRSVQTLYPMLALPMMQVCCFYYDLCDFNRLLDAFMQRHMRKSTLTTFKDVLNMHSLLQVLCYAQREVLVYVLESAGSIPAKARITSRSHVKNAIAMLCNIEEGSQNPFCMTYKLLFHLPYYQDKTVLNMRRQFFLFKLKLAIWNKMQ